MFALAEVAEVEAQAKAALLTCAALLRTWRTTDEFLQSFPSSSSRGIAAAESVRLQSFLTTGGD